MNYLHSKDPTGELHLAATSHPWLLGDGIFETLKSEFGSLFFLDRHIKRLLNKLTNACHFDERSEEKSRFRRKKRFLAPLEMTERSF